MNKHLIKALAIAGLATAATSSAHADHKYVDFDVRVGQSWLQYNIDSRRYDRDYDRRIKNKKRHKKRHRKRHKKQHRHQSHAHETWHRYNDGCWDRYYLHDHAALHRGLRDRHRNTHRHH